MCGLLGLLLLGLGGLVAGHETNRVSHNIQ
jgi:hypothetical protein